MVLKELKDSDNFNPNDSKWHAANIDEAYAFAKKYPNLQCKSWILALGSVAMKKSTQCYVALGYGKTENKRFLEVGSFGDGLMADDQFLFVLNS